MSDVTEDRRARNAHAVGAAQAAGAVSRCYSAAQGAATGGPGRESAGPRQALPRPAACRAEGVLRGHGSRVQRAPQVLAAQQDVGQRSHRSWNSLRVRGGRAGRPEPQGLLDHPRAVEPLAPRDLQEQSRGGAPVWTSSRRSAPRFAPRQARPLAKLFDTKCFTFPALYCVLVA